jgi:cytochrome bd-type quinol oxidase subunit 2
LTTLRLIALALTALIVVPGGAHLFSLPNKIGLDAGDYFTVQQIYAGWALFAVPIVAAILANGALAATERRRDPKAARWALLSTVLILASLGVFFVWVFPGNRATANWTSIPQGWEALRRSWEYGHAANAVILFAALLATGRAIIGSRRQG